LVSVVLPDSTSLVRDATIAGSAQLSCCATALP
jgi:hypothetical protein